MNTNPCRLYVCGFPYSTTEEELLELFTDFGEVREVRILTHKETGLSRGFGFVTMLNAGQAGSALQLDGQKFGRRRLKVEVAQAPAERRSRQMA